LLAGIASAGSTSYIHGASGLIAKINETNITYYHSDHLGSTSAMTDESGNVIEEQVNMPFGQLISGSEKYGFTGKEHDKIGLQYFGARYYNPVTGRFLTVDPAQDRVNWFSYASNNPLKYIDPTGMRAAPPRPMDPTRAFLRYVAEESGILPLFRKVDRGFRRVGRGIKKGSETTKNGIKEFPGSMSNRIQYGVYTPDKQEAIWKFQQRELKRKLESSKKRLRKLGAYIENAEEWYKEHPDRPKFNWEDAPYSSRFEVLSGYNKEHGWFTSNPELKVLVVVGDGGNHISYWFDLKDIAREAGINLAVVDVTDEYLPEDNPKYKYSYDLVIKPDIPAGVDGDEVIYGTPNGVELMMKIENMRIEERLLELMSIEPSPE